MQKKTLSQVQLFNEQRFTKNVVFKQGESLVFVLNFMPGQSLPAHAHPGTKVTILVLEGGGTFVVNGLEFEADQGDIMELEGDEMFSFVNCASRRTSLYVFLNKVPSED